MKRLIIFMLVLGMLLAMALPCLATEGMTISSVEVQPGDDVYLRVTLHDALEGDSIGVSYSYDTSLLNARPKSSTWEKSGTIKNFNNKKAGVWASSSVVNLEGDLFVLAFEVEETAKFSETQVVCDVTIKKGADVVGTYSVTATLSMNCEHEYSQWTDAGTLGHSQTCNNCGKTITSSHIWDEGVVSDNPDDDQTDLQTFTCTVCGGTKVQAVATEPPEVLPTTPAHPTEEPTEKVTYPTAPPVTVPTQPTEPATEPTTEPMVVPEQEPQREPAREDIPDTPQENNNVETESDQSTQQNDSVNSNAAGNANQNNSVNSNAAGNANQNNSVNSNTAGNANQNSSANPSTSDKTNQNTSVNSNTTDKGNQNTQGNSSASDKNNQSTQNHSNSSDKNNHSTQTGNVSNNSDDKKTENQGNTSSSYVDYNTPTEDEHSSHEGHDHAHQETAPMVVEGNGIIETQETAEEHDHDHDHDHVHEEDENVDPVAIVLIFVLVAMMVGLPIYIMKSKKKI